MIVTKKHLAVFGLTIGLLLSLVIFVKWYNPIVGGNLSSAKFPGQVALKREEAVIVGEELSRATRSYAKGCQDPHFYLVIERKRGSEKFFISEDNLVYDAQGLKVLPSEKLLEKLLVLEKRVTEQSSYGEMVNWAEANKIFPRYAKAEVQDVDTGLSFWVQRRAGHAHADVQPLTAKDSDIMKQIYRGRWSWKRKAIVVKVQGHKLAASMNGMPHGAGAISGNKFAGHFCIHFFGCKTHSGHVNLEHQIMVWKAAGRFGDMTSQLTPKKAIEVFFTAVDQEELKLAGHFLQSCSSEEREQLLELLKPIQWVTLKKVKLQAEENEIASKGLKKHAGNDIGKVELLVSLEMGLKGGPAKTTREGCVTLEKHRGSPNWVINGESLVRLLE